MDLKVAKRRARLSLEGVSLGDAFGERFFGPSELYVSQRVLPPGIWQYTDDTVMALSIVELLERSAAIDPDRLAGLFAHKYRADPHRGYGAMAHQILRAVGRGGNWKAIAPAAFDGTGSMGNGGAMRVAPLGAFFADEPDRVPEQAELSAKVTHAHPEGRAGAIAVAAAAAAAARGFPARDLLDEAIAATPSGETRSQMERARELPFETDVRSAVQVLGNGSRIIAPDTVPFALWCAARHLDDFEEAMWTTVSGGGDRDTNCAIVGGIVAPSIGVEGLPAAWLGQRESLDSLAGVGWE